MAEFESGAHRTERPGEHVPEIGSARLVPGLQDFVAFQHSIKTSAGMSGLLNELELFDRNASLKKNNNQEMQLAKTYKPGDQFCAVDQNGEYHCYVVQSGEVHT